MLMLIYNHHIYPISEHSTYTHTHIHTHTHTNTNAHLYGQAWIWKDTCISHLRCHSSNFRQDLNLNFSLVESYLQKCCILQSHTFNHEDILESTIPVYFLCYVFLLSQYLQQLHSFEFSKSNMVGHKSSHP